MDSGASYLPLLVPIQTKTEVIVDSPKILRNMVSGQIPPAALRGILESFLTTICPSMYTLSKNNCSLSTVLNCKHPVTITAFKILLLTCKMLNNKATSYLKPYIMF